MSSSKEAKHQEYLKHKESYLKRAKLWFETNREKHKEIANNYNARLKRIVLAFYSNGEPICACCGLKDIDVLCIDHINGDGAEHRKAIGRKTGCHFYKWLKVNNYPDGFQVLCANCNLKKEVERRRSGRGLSKPN